MRTVIFETHNDARRRQMAVKITLKQVLPQSECAQHLEHAGASYEKYSMSLRENEFALLLTREGSEQRVHMLQENDLSYLLQNTGEQDPWRFAEHVIGLPAGSLELAFEGQIVDIKKQENYEFFLRQLLDIVEQLTKLPDPEFQQCLRDLQALKAERELDSEREGIVAQALSSLASKWRMPEAEDGDAS